jgi:YesN/AraC family two-component response regulator
VKLSFFPEDQHVTTELVINYIKNNYTEKISNAQIAEKFGYNPLYLNRIFKGDTGMTLHKYILKERVTLAKQLLKNTTLSVEEIGADCGFANQTHFCTAFKTVTGKSPTAYRNG